MIDPQASEAVPPCQAHPESVDARLAAFLKGKQEAVVQEWLNRMMNDAAIKTETLTTRELKAQLPALFEDLVKALCEYGSDAVAQKSDLDSARHGAMRWRQGYDLTELLREISHLRVVFIYYLHLFEELHPDFGMVERLFAFTTVHRFLDDMMTAAAEQFVKAERAESRQA